MWDIVIGLAIGLSGTILLLTCTKMYMTHGIEEFKSK